MKKTTLLLFVSLYPFNTNSMLRVVDKRYAQKLSHHHQFHSVERKVFIPSLKKENKKPEPLIAPTLCAVLEKNIFTIRMLCAPYKSLEEAVSTLKSLIYTNKFLERFINDDKRTLELIKKLSQQFDCSNMEAAGCLGTKAAVKRFVLQTGFFDKLILSNFNISYANLLKKKGFDVNFSTFFDFELPQLPLLRALYQGEIQAAEWLIENGADINALTTRNQNAVMLVIPNLNMALIDKFLDHPHFHVHHKDSSGDTLLHYCFYSNQNIKFDSHKDEIECRYKIVQKLLNKKADPTAVNYNGKTPLDLARELKDQGLIDLMEKAAASLNHNRSFRSGNTHLYSSQKKILVPTPEQFSPHTLCVLLEQGIFTLPTLCYTYRSQDGPFFHDQILKRSRDAAFLVNSLAQTNKFLNTFVNDPERTLDLIKKLSHCCNSSDLTIARQLCTKGAQERFHLQKSFLSSYTTNFSLDIFYARYLKREGLDCNFSSFRRHSFVLFEALFRRDESAVRWLVSNGADIRVSDNSTCSAFMLILADCSNDFIHEILKSVVLCDVRYRNSNNDTPLHYCFFKFESHYEGFRYCPKKSCSCYKYGIIAELLKRGADPLAMNNQGFTPFDWAKESEDKNLIDLMQWYIDNPTHEQDISDFDSQKNADSVC